MDIKLGTQLCVDQGYKSLIPDTRYYYLGPWSQPCVLLFFFRKGGYQRVATTRIDRKEFEFLISPGVEVICLCEKQLHRPPWMESYEATNFSEREDLRRDTKSQEHDLRVREKIEMMGAALSDEAAILSSDNPVRALNSYAEAAGAHPYRFASDFFSYVLHGKDQWALMPRWFVNGRWDREEKGKKFGRPALARNYCFNFPLNRDMRRRIVSFARKNKGYFRTFVAFHAELLRREFKCIELRAASGSRIFSTQGDPFPSPNQAYRAVDDELSDEEYAALFGKQKRIRPTRLFNQGNFTEQFCCNLEAIESDGYVIDDVLRSLVSEKATTKVVVVRIICGGTSCRVGVGFSVGGERKEAYRAAFYSMLAPRHYLEKIYGLNDGCLETWVSGGMAAFSTSDRGPAAWNIIIDEFDSLFPLQTIAPSREPLSKALVEASNPRTPDTSLDNIHIESNLTVAGVIKRELLRAVADNNGRDVSGRLSDSMLAEMHQLELPATPNGLWEFNRRKGRNAGDSDMSHQEAIRMFWEPIKVKLSRDGVLHHDSPYTSPALRESGVLNRLGSDQEIELRAYALSCAIGFLHVEVNGELIEVERVRRLRLPHEDYAQTSEDLAEARDVRAILRSEQRVNAVAALVGGNQQAVEQTGEPLSGGRVREGRKPSGRKSAGNEISAIRSHTKSQRS